MELIFLGVIFFLSLSNGANDNFKGMATVWGSNTLSYKKTLVLANIFTALGVLCSVFLGEQLLNTFSGKGIIDPSVLSEPVFALSFAFGAGITVFLATILRFPISTTHSIIGGLVGSGISSIGFEAIHFGNLMSKALIPLLISPFIAIILTFVLWNIMKNFSLFSAFRKIFFLKSSGKAVQKKENILDSLHVCSGATVSFARGLNDAPKIFSILLLSTSLSPIYGIIGILVFMIIGGVFLSKGIAKTMSKEITTMTHKQGFIGNFVTAIIVLFASKIGLPVSTTHMSVSSMFGIGIISSGARIKKIIEIILSWVLTLPVAFICSYIIFQIFSGYFG